MKELWILVSNLFHSQIIIIILIKMKILQNLMSVNGRIEIKKSFILIIILCNKSNKILNKELKYSKILKIVGIL